MPGVQKSVLNLEYVYAWGAMVCLRFGACLCTVCNGLPEIWDTIMPGVQKSVRNLGHHFARCAMTVSKLGHDIARGAETCPESVAYK